MKSLLVRVRVINFPPLLKKREKKRMDITSFEDEHEAFAASRVSQYVYVPTKDTVFSALDQHADTLEGDVKLPLVLLGNEGSGKSALLANWVAKRREHLHRDEFLYQHFVGCTTESLQLSNTLQRLETALKRFFQLREMKVPDSEEELRWSLNRFLSAAAKKHNPARIIIIIDGVNRLKSEGALDGLLHWLPTELPPCVRFILSTVEFERLPAKGKVDIPQHRTFIELTRRKCPTLRVEPLNVNVRHHVINSFVARNVGRIELTENHQFKMVTAPATSQPMYLRSLLQAVRLASSLVSMGVDHLLEIFLSCGTAHDLLHKTLDLCCQAVFPPIERTHENYEELKEMNDPEVLGKIFTIIHASKSGLTEVEIWGVIKMVTRSEPMPDIKLKLMHIVKDFTMVVNNMYSFSHELYREVVYEKWIKSHDAMTRWHLLMARYFGQLPPCDRKLTSQPYHLEVAGSWSKVKNCLTEIEMFQLWWSPKFKRDFIKLWASLTLRQPNLKRDDHGLTLKSKTKDSVDSHNTASRPSYDVVEEYVKSLDEYRTTCHPSDEAVANIILMIGDFLLEFATLGHEKEADVPNYIHPLVPSEDLCTIGVPHIVVDDEGRSTLMYPSIFPTTNPTTENDGAVDNAATKAIEDIPICTTYFFQRWMWIQFPYIALGNCNNRYMEGIKMKEEFYDNRFTKSKKAQDDQSVETDGPQKKMIEKREMNTTRSADAFKLPEIKFHRKAARSSRRVNHDIVDEAQAAADKFTKKMTALQDDIQNYREEHDFVMQMKLGLNKRLAQLKGSLVELERSEESMTQFDGTFKDVYYKEKEAVKQYEQCKVYHRNLTNLVLMCDRHPAKMPSLILEVENKIAQDTFLLAEIKKRLWEQRFEFNTHVTNFRKMKELVREGVAMHNKRLEYKYDKKHALEEEVNQKLLEDEKKAEDLTTGTLNVKKKSRGNKRSTIDEGKSSDMIVKDGATWEDKWSVISSRTGIIEPEIFFQRVNNRAILEDQINTLKKTSEYRLESLKNEVVEVEQELEAARYDASLVGGLSCKDEEKQVVNKQTQLKHIKERSEVAQLQVQDLISGLRHIAEVMGIQPEEHVDAFYLLRELDSVFDTLMAEREKQLQAANQSTTESRMMQSNRDITLSPETHFRSPELEVAVSKFEHSTVRLPLKLPSKPVASIKSARTEDEEDQDDDGMLDRTYVKNQAEKTLKLKKKNVKNTTATVSQ